MARSGWTPVGRLKATLRSPWRRLYARRVAPLVARAQPSMLALWRDLSVLGSPPWIVQSWIVGAWVTQAMSVVARLGIADLLKEGPRTCDELAQSTGSHAPTLYRILRGLGALGLFSEDEHGRFESTRLGRYLENDSPDSVRAMAILMGEEWHWQAWGKLLHSVQSGEAAFTHVNGMEPYDYLARNPAASDVFSKHMEEYARRAAFAAAIYDFSNLESVVDVGGGYGAVITSVLRTNPKMRGILFDRPEVIERARPRITAAGLATRCELASGSFFESVPTGGDAYLLSSIIHDWDDNRAIAILENCRRAMAPSGRLLLVEVVIPPGNIPSDGKIIDLQMLVVFPGGRERTAAEYGALLEAAGFQLTRIIPTPYSMSVIEGQCA